MSHLAAVRAMPCILCELLSMQQESKTDAHHPRTGQGGSQKAPDSIAIPLCHDRCHQGPHGIHGDRALLRQAKVDEIDLIGIIVDRRLGSLGNVPRVTARRVKPPARTVSSLTSSKVLKHSGEMRR